MNSHPLNMSLLASDHKLETYLGKQDKAAFRQQARYCHHQVLDDELLILIRCCKRAFTGTVRNVSFGNFTVCVCVSLKGPSLPMSPQKVPPTHSAAMQDSMSLTRMARSCTTPSPVSRAQPLPYSLKRHLCLPGKATRVVKKHTFPPAPPP